MLAEGSFPTGKILPQVEGVRFTETALAFTNEELPLDEWERLVRSLVVADRGARWWIGDAIAFAKQRYGSTYTAALKSTRLRLGTLQRYAWLARAVPPESRIEQLSWSAHRAVCEAVLKPSERLDWLARAREESWNARELRRELRRSAAGRPARFPKVTDADIAPDVTCPNCGHGFDPRVVTPRLAVAA